MWAHEWLNPSQYPWSTHAQWLHSHYVKIHYLRRRSIDRFPLVSTSLSLFPNVGTFSSLPSLLQFPRSPSLFSLPPHLLLCPTLPLPILITPMDTDKSEGAAGQLKLGKCFFHAEEKKRKSICFSCSIPKKNSFPLLHRYDIWHVWSE